MNHAEQNQFTTKHRAPPWPRVRVRHWKKGEELKTAYKIDVTVDGKREHKTFGTIGEATNYAWQMYREKEAGGRAAFELPMTQRVEAAKCFKLLRDYAGASLSEAVGYYIDRKLRFRESPTVAEGVERLIEQFTSRRAKSTVADMRHRWRKFAAEFGKRQFTEIETSEITAWLDSASHHPESRHNYRRKIVELFNLAAASKWCAENPAKGTRKDDRTPPNPGVFQVEEFARLLEHADDCGLIPYLVLGTFCGLRPSEIKGLDWSKVNFAERAVVVEAVTCKTRTRRVVEINDTAAAWLAPHVKRSGLVLPFSTIKLRRLRRELRHKSEMKHWPHNVMRHSFGSYALAAWQDVTKVSHEMGNSPAMVHRHYKQIVTKRDAARFWVLLPEERPASKVIEMPKTVTA